jgi:hypothetical protein
MKKYTHPRLSYTSIHYKDGSFQNKYWNYLRSSLVLEAISSKRNTKSASVAYKIYTYSNTTLQRYKQRKQADNFWSI